MSICRRFCQGLTGRFGVLCQKRAEGGAPAPGADPGAASLHSGWGGKGEGGSRQNSLGHPQEALSHWEGARLGQVLPFTWACSAGSARMTEDDAEGALGSGGLGGAGVGLFLVGVHQLREPGLPTQGGACLCVLPGVGHLVAGPHPCLTVQVNVAGIVLQGDPLGDVCGGHSRDATQREQQQERRPRILKQEGILEATQPKPLNPSREAESPFLRTQNLSPSCTAQ